MALKLYRRHRTECEGQHPEDHRSGEFEEGRRGWKKCACLIHVSGTVGGTFNRKQTGTADWTEAKALAKALETADWWDSTPAPKPEPPPAEAPSKRITIAEAVKVYLANHAGTKIEPPTLSKYRTFTKQLTAFADSLGYVMLDQFTLADIDVFYATWDLGARTKGQRLLTLRGFFKFCVNRKWLPETPVSSDIKPPIGANRVANKAPFTDDELKRIIDACDRVVTVEWSNGRKTGAWTGEDVKDFIWLLTYTGLRISDVGLFNMNRVQGNDVLLRAKKNGGEVFAYLPDWLCDRLNARVKRCGVRPFIPAGYSDRLETVAALWRRKIDKAFELAGPFEEPPTPHRFRHTFARILLQSGVQVADVADLLGDDEKTVREHYSRWVPERQARLTKILKDAFDDKPKPKLVAMPGGRA